MKTASALASCAESGTGGHSGRYRGQAQRRDRQGPGRPRGARAVAGPGLTPRGSSADELGSANKAQLAKYAALIKEAGIKAE
jgi:hypothetical protein